MGTMTLQIVMEEGEPISYSVALPDIDVERISVAYAAILFPNGVAVEGGDPRLPTGSEVLGAAAAAMARQMTDTAFQWHRKKAIRDAEASVSPINVTPVE